MGLIALPIGVMARPMGVMAGPMGLIAKPGSESRGGPCANAKAGSISVAIAANVITCMICLLTPS